MLSGESAKGLFSSAGAGVNFRAARRRKAADLTGAFAERLAEHGDIGRAADEIGVSRARGRGLFKRICDQLGEQAA